MSITYFLGSGNPFFQAFFDADLLGKGIFLSLLLLSLVTWILFIYKWTLFSSCSTKDQNFLKQFHRSKESPLSLSVTEETLQAPFPSLYLTLQEHTLQILHKNQASLADEGFSMLTHADMQQIDVQLLSKRKAVLADLEKHLYYLSTIVTLAPFLGLLGTVWGILTTFSSMQTQTTGSTNQLVLGGLSLALATTVLGLLDAIPALLGYNILRAKLSQLQTEMEKFSSLLLAEVELQYRHVDL